MNCTALYPFVPQCTFLRFKLLICKYIYTCSYAKYLVVVVQGVWAFQNFQLLNST